MVALWVLLGLIVIYFGFRFFMNSGLKKIPAAQLAEWVKADNQRLVVDVREVQEYTGGHFPGAINVPLSQLSGKLDKIPNNTDVAVICRSGNRSMQAARILKKSGYKQIVNVSHGMMGWKGQTEKGAKPGKLK